MKAPPDIQAKVDLCTTPNRVQLFQQLKRVDRDEDDHVVRPAPAPHDDKPGPR